MNVHKIFHESMRRPAPLPTGQMASDRSERAGSVGGSREARERALAVQQSPAGARTAPESSNG